MRIGEPTLKLGDTSFKLRDPCLSFHISGRFRVIPRNTIAGSGWEHPKEFALLDDPRSARFIANGRKPAAFDGSEHCGLTTAGCLRSLAKCVRHAGSPGMVRERATVGTIATAHGSGG